MTTTIADALRAILIADSTVQGLVASRIYPKRLPDRPTYPAITYERVATGRSRGLGAPSGRVRPLFRLHCWGGVRYGDAEALANAVRGALDGHVGTQSGVRIDWVVLENQNDDFDPEANIHREILDFRISHIE